MGTILVVDDEARVVASLERLLSAEGHHVVTARRGEEALARVEESPPELLLMDVRMPGMDGLEVFRKVKAAHPKMPVVIMTGFGTTDLAIEATRLGAFDYLIKPFEPTEILRVVEQGLECVRLMSREVGLARIPDAPAGDALIGDSAPMQKVYKLIGRVAETDVTVLVRGETGTGKGLVARALYQNSRRREAPLLLVNCVAIPETLLESELFGYEKGAFTGAGQRRIGKFEQAHGGTILLDEIGDIPLGVQAKILRVLQDKNFERIGGSETIHTNVRILAATNRNLERAIADGEFREDLYHRLNVVTITIPPLRERREDIPSLVGYFLDRSAWELGLERPAITQEALDALRAYAWPGNVRELEHCMRRVVLFTRGYPVRASDVDRALTRPEKRPDASGAVAGEAWADTLREMVRAYLAGPHETRAHRHFMKMADRLLVAEALRLAGGNQTRAARLLGMTRPTFQAKMQAYGIRRETLIKDE